MNSELKINNVDYLYDEFIKETRALERIFSRELNSMALTDVMKKEFENNTLPYKNITIKYCYNCCCIITLNEYLKKWKIYINNNIKLVNEIDALRKKKLFCENLIKDRFELLQDENNWNLCGCSDFNREQEEIYYYNKYLKDKKNIQLENEYMKKIIWRTNYITELVELENQIDYFKRIPHKVYRDNILFELMTATNMDCVSKILEYL